MTTQAITLQTVDARSRRRHEMSRRRIYILAIFVVVIFVIMASLLQIQQNHIRAFLNQQCVERRANTIHTNDVLRSLGEIERHNDSIDPKIRGELLAVYESARLAVPVCG